MVTKGIPCLGPVTQGGCGNLCPAGRPRLLRLLRPQGRRQHRGAGRGAGRARGRPAHDPGPLRRLHRRRARLCQGASRHDAITRGHQVEALARVEGEGRFKVRLEGGKVVRSEFSIFEPPRYFEGLLRGRSYQDAPDVTSRICGICPIAYIMGASQAMEDALGWQVPQPIADLRRLIYCGEWIQSHVLAHPPAARAGLPRPAGFDRAGRSRTAAWSRTAWPRRRPATASWR